MRCLTLCVMLVCMAGCADRPARVYELSAPDPEQIRLPEKTPYDHDPGMRAVYLNYYWLGYREAARGVGSSYCGNGHPWYEVQRDGFYAGQSDGFAAFPPVSVRH